MSGYWLAETSAGRRVLVVAVDVGRREVVVTDLDGRPAWIEELRHVRFVLCATEDIAVTNWLAGNPAREIE